MTNLVPDGQQVNPDYLADWVEAQDGPVYMVISDQTGYVSAHLDPNSAEQDYVNQLNGDDGVYLIQKRRSRQKKHGGGKFKSEAQRRYMWAVVPKAAKRWAHNKKTRKPHWIKRGSGARAKVSPR